MYRLTLSLISLAPLLIAQEITLPSIAVTDTKDTPIQSAEDAQMQNNFTLQERLENDTSFFVTSGGKYEKLLSYRGIDPRATEYIQDGIPLYRTVNGFVDTTFYSINSDLMFNDGSAPSSSGVAAMGGEVNLPTKVPTKSVEARVLGSISNNDHRLEGDVSSKIGTGYFQIQSSYSKASDFDLSQNFTPTPVQAEGKRINADQEQKSVSLKAGITLDEHTDIAAKIQTTRSSFGMPPNIYTDSSSSPCSATVPCDAYARLNTKDLNSLYLYGDHHSDIADITARAYYDRYADTYDFYKDATYSTLLFPSSRYDDTRIGGNLKFTLENEKMTNTFFFKSERNTHHWLSDNSRHDTDNLEASYLFNYFFTPRVKLEGGISYRVLIPHENYQNKQVVDAQLKLSRNFDSWTLWVALSKKSRFPSMDEMFTFFPWNTPNPQLKPEQSQNIELGYTQSLGEKTLLSLSGYRYEIKDMILYDNNQFINRESAKHFGFDTKISTDLLDHNHLNLSYGYAHTQDSAGERLVLIPEHKFTLQDNIDLLSGLQGSVVYQFVGERDSRYVDKIYHLSNYQTVDTYLSYKHKSMSYRFGIKNIFDTEYEWNYGYPAQGRSLFASLQWEM